VLPAVVPYMVIYMEDMTVPAWQVRSFALPEARGALVAPLIVQSSNGVGRALVVFIPKSFHTHIDV